MATATLVSMDEYERMSFERDVEYVDGALKERGMVMSVHGLIQGWLATWFNNYGKEWRCKAAVEVRTRVASGRVRLPDVVVGRRTRWPQTLVEPPLIAVEMVSPSDSFGDVEDVVGDYQQMGVENVWVIDPQKRYGWQCEPDKWVATRTFRTKSGPMYVELEALWSSLDEGEEDEGAV